MAILKRKRRDGSITFQVRVRDRVGKWFPYSTFDNNEDALFKEAELLKLRSKGGESLTGEAKKITLDEYWDVWSSENRTSNSEGWKISQDQMYRDYIQPILGSKKLIDIRIPEIGRVMNQTKKLGRADSTCRMVYSLLHKMFEDAVEYYQMLASNPVKKKFHRPHVKQKKRPFLLPAEAWKLLESVQDHYLGPAIWIQILAGLRVEAVIGLVWKDSISWDSNHILICRAWKQKEGRMTEYPKGGDQEYVPMIPTLKTYLLSLWEQSRDKNAFVCQSKKGGKLSYNTYQQALPLLCKRAGVSVVTTHELRHSSTEIWMQQGASEEDIRRLLNHSANSNATKLYIHRTDDRLNSIGQKILPPKSGTENKEMFPKKFPNGNNQTYTAIPYEEENVH